MCLFNLFNKTSEDKMIIIETIDINEDDTNYIRDKMISYFKKNEENFIKYFNENYKITDITINYSDTKFIYIFSLKYSPNELEDIILMSPYSRLHSYIFIDIELENYI